MLILAHVGVMKMKYKSNFLFHNGFNFILFRQKIKQNQKYWCNFPPFCASQRFARSTPNPYNSRTVAQNSGE